MSNFQRFTERCNTDVQMFKPGAHPSENRLEHLARSQSLVMHQ